MTVSPTQPAPGSALASGTAPSLERIGWPVMFSAVAYGVRIRVRLNDPAVAGEVGRHLPPGSKREEFSDSGRVYSFVVEDEDHSGRRRTAVYVDGALLTRCSTLHAALRLFESNEQLHVAEMAPEHVFVHAGAVGYRGRGILLPGRSFAGKSTLVAELVRAGAEYYSDEYAVLDSLGNVHPYARPISMRWKGPTKQPLHTAWNVGSAPLPVGLVVLSKFRPGGEWRPRCLSPGQGALAMLANTVCARRAPEIALATLHRVVTRAPIITSERGEASGVVELILALAGSERNEDKGSGGERDGDVPAEDL